MHVITEQVGVRRPLAQGRIGDIGGSNPEPFGQGVKQPSHNTIVPFPESLVLRVTN